MKVLHITPHITNPSNPCFMRNQTGFGYMVFDIANHISNFCDIDMFVVNTFSSQIDLDGVHILVNSWKSYISGLSLKNIKNSLAFILKYRLTIKRSLREFYMYTSVGQLSRCIKKYDIVHIHGCGPITDSAIKICELHKVPFLVTLHGLNSFEDAISLPSSLKQYERDLLADAAKYNLNFSFISSGNKKKVESILGKVNDSFSVVCNGCSIIQKTGLSDIRKKYNIRQDDFVFVFVGNISKNKNQIQVARAWKLLPDERRNKCKILFVGNFKDDDDVVQYIKEHELESNLILAGGQPKNNIHKFYQACNATVLTSLTDGFGLSIIEGFVYGKPSLTFSDLPATEDIYSKDAVVLCEDRSDETLASGMLAIMDKDFHYDRIIQHAQKFSYQVMASNYIQLYKKILSKSV